MFTSFKLKNKNKMVFFTEEQTDADAELITNHEDRLDTLILMIGENRSDIDVTDFQDSVRDYFKYDLNGPKIEEGITLLDENTFMIFEHEVMQAMDLLNQVPDGNPPTYIEYLDIFIDAYIEAVQNSTGRTLSTFKTEIEEVNENEDFQRALQKIFYKEPWRFEKEGRIPNPIYYVGYYVWLLKTPPEDWLGYEAYLDSDEGGNIDQDEWFTQLDEEEEEESLPAAPAIEVIAPLEVEEPEATETTEATEATEEPDPEPEPEPETEVTEEPEVLTMVVSMADVKAYLAKEEYKGILTLDEATLSVMYPRRGSSLDLRTIATVAEIGTWKTNEDDKAIDKIIEDNDIAGFMGEFSYLWKAGTLTAMFSALGLAIKFFTSGGLSGIMGFFGGEKEEEAAATFGTSKDLFEKHFAIPEAQSPQILQVRMYSLAQFANERDSGNYDGLSEKVPADDFATLQTFRKENPEQFDAFMTQVFDDFDETENLSENPADYLPSKKNTPDLTVAAYFDSSAKKDGGQISWTTT